MEERLPREYVVLGCYTVLIGQVVPIGKVLQALCDIETLWRVE